MARSGPTRARGPELTAGAGGKRVTLPEPPRPRLRLSVALFLLFLGSGLVPLVFLVPAGFLPFRQAQRWWTLSSVEQSLDASIAANRAALQALRRALEQTGEHHAARFGNLLPPGARENDMRTELIQDVLSTPGVDFVLLFRQEAGVFILVASASRFDRPIPSVSIAVPDSPTNDVGPLPPLWYPVRDVAGDAIAVPVWLPNPPPSDGAGAFAGALVLGTALGPGYYDRFERATSGLAFYRRLEEVGAVLRSGYGLLVGLALVVSVVVSFLLARRVASGVSRPIEELAAAMTAVGERRVPGRLAAVRFPEVETLARSFEQMRATLDRYEDRLRDAEQVRGARETARFVAHELRNSLTPVHAAMQILEKKLASRDRGEDERGARALGLIRREADRMARLASTFSEYAHLPEPRPERLALAAILDELAGPEIPERIRWRLTVGPSLPDLEVDRDELERLLRNLIRNAVEAIEGAGSIEIEAVSKPDGDGVEITIRDSGRGIDPQTLREIYQPGFTTKENGSGLGLALVRRSLARYGGTIRVESSPGVGTTAIVNFPSSALAAPKETRHG